MTEPRTVLSLVLAASLAACSDAPAPRAPEPPAPVAQQPAASPAPEQPSLAGTLKAAAKDAASDAVASAVDPSKWRTSTSADDATVVEVAGLRAPKPASWVWTKPSMQFRTLQYAVAGEGDSTKAADLIISVFMGDDGGPLDANITRWKGQFRVGDAAPEAKLSDKQIGPMKVTFVELEGDYMAMGAPAPRKDFSQIGAITEATGRKVFFRLIGPKETVEANRADFMKMIDGLMPAD
jgi:hypothetical protein